MTCPSCGCETPAGGGFCDLCGEPFAKKKAESVSSASAASPAVKPAVVSADLMKKLLDQRSEAAVESAERGPIPEEFRGLDTGGAIPEIPPEARKLAWTLLAVVLAWILFMIAWMFGHRERIAAGLEGGSSPAPAEPKVEPQ